MVQFTVYTFKLLTAPYEVTVLQLKKMFGKSKEAKEFIKSLIKGPLAYAFHHGQ